MRIAEQTEKGPANGSDAGETTAANDGGGRISVSISTINHVHLFIVIGDRYVAIFCFIIDSGFEVCPQPLLTAVAVSVCWIGPSQPAGALEPRPTQSNCKLPQPPLTFQRPPRPSILSLSLSSSAHTFPTHDATPLSSIPTPPTPPTPPTMTTTKIDASQSL